MNIRRSGGINALEKKRLEWGHSLRLFKDNILLSKHTKAPKETQTDLFSLLNLDPNNRVERKQVDNEAIMQEIERTPEAAKRTYAFKNVRYSDSVSSNDTGYSCYPLHQAIMLGASLDVIDALHRCYPPATQAELKSGSTALHLSFRYLSPPKVVLYLADKMPLVIRQESPSWCTVLHCACKYDQPLTVIQSLLEQWPEASLKQNAGGLTPLGIANIQDAPADTQNFIFWVSQICRARKMDRGTVVSALQFFHKSQWWTGVLLTIDRHPAIAARRFDVDDLLLPNLLSLLGRSCKITTVWGILCNMQDILATT
uniref:Uncharacterized protein n=1 Tax=Ditylum brightwellii TaxID=49249 RepID=A0A6V2AND4_9STRA|mmetsp:Transcript_8042/g.12040  ORF Transcript_8042/g.12040 Transcript_8042/m.12040 type:complete len:313 (+) Transcript_8042:54-992(+)